MIKPKILVTSAAGRTGASAVSRLLELGFPVRAMVRRNDKRANWLKQSGAEVFIGDQLSFNDLRQAMLGVQRAYHCPPFAPNLLENLMMFALAAEEAKLERRIISRRGQCFLRAQATTRTRANDSIGFGRRRGL